MEHCELPQILHLQVPCGVPRGSPWRASSCLPSCQGRFRIRPPLPQYKSTFDIVPVLAYIRSLPTASISLQLLSFKALFLAIYSSISRVSSMARLAPSLEETQDSAILHLLSLEKQSREGRICGFFQIPKFLEDREHCPFYALQTYFTMVRSANFELFILLTYVLAGVQYPRRQCLLFHVICQATQVSNSPDSCQVDAANPHQGWSQSQDLGSTLRESGCKLKPLHSLTARLGTNM